MMDVAVSAKVLNVEHLPGPCCTGLEKSQECAFVADIGEVSYITLQIGLYI